MHRVSRQKPSRLHPFAVVLQACSACAPQVLHTACDANRATLAFHEHLHRLTEQQSGGESRLIQHQVPLPVSSRRLATLAA